MSVPLDESTSWRAGIPPRGNPIFGVIDIFVSLNGGFAAGTLWLNERRHERAQTVEDNSSQEKPKKSGSQQPVGLNAVGGRGGWCLEESARLGDRNSKDQD